LGIVDLFTAFFAGVFFAFFADAFFALVVDFFLLALAIALISRTGTADRTSVQRVIAAAPCPAGSPPIVAPGEARRTDHLNIRRRMAKRGPGQMAREVPANPRRATPLLQAGGSRPETLIRGRSGSYRAARR
jgi:hypothetical protein